MDAAVSVEFHFDVVKVSQVPWCQFVPFFSVSLIPLQVETQSENKKNGKGGKSQ